MDNDSSSGTKGRSPRETLPVFRRFPGLSRTEEDC